MCEGVWAGTMLHDIILYYNILYYIILYYIIRVLYITPGIVLYYIILHWYYIMVWGGDGDGGVHGLEERRFFLFFNSRSSQCK